MRSLVDRAYTFFWTVSRLSSVPVTFEVLNGHLVSEPYLAHAIQQLIHSSLKTHDALSSTELIGEAGFRPFFMPTLGFQQR